MKIKKFGNLKKIEMKTKAKAGWRKWRDARAMKCEDTT
jgi:hypothetical protein